MRPSAISRKSLHEQIQRTKLVVFDFDGVFTDNFVYVHDDGSESLRFWRSDGLGLQKLKKRGLKLLVLSTEKNHLVSVRCQKLKIPCVQGVKNKWKKLQTILHLKKLQPNQVAFVGNDINDLECLSNVGLPIVVRDVHPDVAGLARYRTKIKGGQGAVREVCDLFDNILAK